MERVTIYLIILMVAALGAATYDTVNRQPDIPQDSDHLKTLPYITETPIQDEDKGKANVVEHKPNAYPNLNVYCDDMSDTIYYVDMYGNTVNSIDLGTDGCAVIVPLSPRELYVMIADKGVMRVGWNSSREWTMEGRTHHDLSLDGDGNLYVLTNRRADIPEISEDIPVVDNQIEVYTPEGEMIGNHSISGILLNDRNLTERMAESAGNHRFYYPEQERALDFLHTNSIHYIGGTDAFPGGDVLVCVREINTLAVLDLDREEVLWQWGYEDLQKPHHATLLGTGKVLVFDNGVEVNHSRVLEVNPKSMRPIWIYKGDPVESFYSLDRGGAQRLPNGNTLITESAKGRAFEVTEDKEIVWEYWNPHVGEGGTTRNTFYRFVRLTFEEKPMEVDHNESIDPLEVCKRIEDRTHRNECVLSHAKEAKDQSICDTLDTGWRDSCHLEFAIHQNDPEYCSLMEDETMRRECVDEVNLQTEDYLLCTRITDKRVADRCLERVALREMNPRYCGRMANGTKCYMELASLTSNISLCDRITDNMLRSACSNRS
ncbi:MAG: hypothetical protein GF416_03095 [Candidatus Altiarchaeales archaeon]|nr:hypothetical protein [Candidatus Altiarchaeales archaeon]MBD3416107.1 hypothetical protein [Candidatus Altiarchaeales archaeon]